MALTRTHTHTQVVIVQDKIYPVLSLFVAFSLPLLIFSDKPQALIYGGFWARLLTWHSTWCVNSVAHYFGEDEYGNEISAKVCLKFFAARARSGGNITASL